MAESTGSSSAGAPATAAPAGFEDEEDEEALIQRALEMSMRDMEGASQPAASASQPESQPATISTNMEEDEDEELQRALALSMAGGDAVDPEFVNQLLGNSDMSDPLIQAALEQLQSQQNHEEKKDEEKSKKRKSDDI